MGQRIMIGPVVFSYAWVLEPKADKRGNLKYSAQIIIKKSDKRSIKIINDAVEAEFQAEKGFLGIKSDKMPKASASFKLPLRDGDDEGDGNEALEGCMFFNASSNSKPGIVDKNLKPIIDPDEIYSGMIGFMSGTVKAFNNESKGITIYLNNIQKVKDGPRLDGKASAESDFKNNEWHDDEDPDEDDDDIVV